jgi:geranylgeranyl pyrophosphate synthase
MCEGEILEEQMRAAGHRPSVAVYLHITETKTADLVSACCLAGGLLNGAPEQAIASLGEYGRSLGLLFQIADDLDDGDGVLGDRDVMRSRACEYGAQAEGELRSLPRGEATDMLRELAGFILTRSHA